MSLRLVLWAVLIWGAFMLLRRIQRPRRDAAPTSAASANDTAAIDMVRCAHCGVHLSRDQAIVVPAPSGNHYYCSPKHIPHPS